jgi:NTP pyrophosphatase (non-canonical NTP hydrolase)
MTQPELINLLVRDCHLNAVSKDFWAASQNIGEKLMLVNTELGEFFEKYRKGDLSADEHCPDFTNQTIEIADTIIRLLDLAGWLEMHNLGEAIQAKMIYNLTRPSLHGKKF